MSSNGSLWVPTPRQYRPTYTRLYSSTSTSNFGSPFVQKTTPPALETKRRRTASTFPSIEQLHSAPTVASSALTASVSSNDISNPTPRPHRLSVRPRSRSPTRIPTPLPYSKLLSPIRSVSSPAAPRKLQENQLPTTHRLLGPIPPGPPPPNTLTRSRTMNVLSSLTSTFSRSTHSLTSSRNSYDGLSSQATLPTPSYLPVPACTANIRQVNSSMPTSYWLGRHQALHDRFRSDYLDSSFLESPSKRAHWTSIPDDAPPNAEAEPVSSFRAEERLSKRVFIHLDALCVTAEARKSLKAFQQAYARKFACEALLPLGGRMVDREPGLIAKAGRLFSGGGRKSSFGVSRRRSALSMSFTIDGADTGASADA